MTAHTITTTWNEIEVEIAYDFHAAELDVNYPDTVDLVSTKVRSSKGIPIDQDALDRWAERWLHGVGYELAVANAAKGAKS